MNKPDISVPPGETIKTMLESRGWSVSYLADSMSCSASVVRELIEGKREITREVALALGLSFGEYPASFWQTAPTPAEYIRAGERAMKEEIALEATKPLP